MKTLYSLDRYLIRAVPLHDIAGLRRFWYELLFFTLKEARATLFAGLFFLSVFLVPKEGIMGIARYDALFIIAVAIQVWMVLTKLESLDELKAITFFHILGFAMEVFKTSSGIGSWAYPDFGYTKILGVPLFSGFMYAAVGSYVIQAWRLLDLQVKHHPPYWLSGLVAVLIYANFFMHHFIGDYRWYMVAFIMGLYARTFVVFRPYDKERKMPLLLAFVLIGFFIWIAENISTFFGLWYYPDQVDIWTHVHWGKWSSWSLLVIMTFTIVTHLKHIKERVSIPE